MSRKPPPLPGRRPSGSQLSQRISRGATSRLEATRSKKSADKTLIIILVVLLTVVFALILLIAGITLGVATGVLPGFRSLGNSKQDILREKDKQTSKDGVSGSESSNGDSSHDANRIHEKSGGKDNSQDNSKSEGSDGEQSRGKEDGEPNSAGQKRAVDNEGAKADQSGTESGNGDKKAAGAGGSNQGDGSGNPGSKHEDKDDDTARPGPEQRTVKTSGVNTEQSHAGTGDTEQPGDGNNPSGEKHKEYDRHGDFFGVPAAGTRIVYLLDCSKKMFGQPFVTAGSGLEKSLGSLSDGQKFFVIEFADDSYNMFFPKTVKDFVPATLENQTRVHQWLKVEEIKPLGIAKPDQALRRALEFHPTTIFFLSHVGVENTLLEEIKNKNTDGSVINVFGIGVEEEAKSLRKLAAQNNGTYRDVEVPK